VLRGKGHGENRAENGRQENRTLVPSSGPGSAPCECTPPPVQKKKKKLRAGIGNNRSSEKKRGEEPHLHRFPEGSRAPQHQSSHQRATKQPDEPIKAVFGKMGQKLLIEGREKASGRQKEPRCRNGDAGGEKGHNKTRRKNHRKNTIFRQQKWLEGGREKKQLARWGGKAERAKKNQSRPKKRLGLHKNPAHRGRRGAHVKEETGPPGHRGGERDTREKGRAPERA